VRVALISDLHGNEAALLAVFADLDRRGVDQVACLGDVCTLGPRPREVLDLVQARCAHRIVGNHDDFLLDPELLRTYTQAAPIVRAVDWCAERMEPGDLAALRTFTAEAALDLGHGATLRLFHGTPLSHMQNLLATTSADELDAMLAGRAATVLAGGHTHLQMVRQHRGMWVVNPGSTGAPFRAFVDGAVPELMPYAEYAVVESRPGGHVEVALCRAPVDGRRVRVALGGGGHPLHAALAAQYG
jgi:predicted phosphodiesterase